MTICERCMHEKVCYLRFLHTAEEEKHAILCGRFVPNRRARKRGIQAVQKLRPKWWRRFFGFRPHIPKGIDEMHGLREEDTKE